MLTYATLDDFLQMKDLNKTGVVQGAALASGYDKIETYLRRATAYVNRITRREFFPYVQQQEYPVPYAVNDLSMRRYPDAHIKLTEDLLEVDEFLFATHEITSDYWFTLDHNIYPKTVAVIKFGGLSNLIYAPNNRYDEANIYITGMWGYHDSRRYPEDAWIDTQENVPVAALTSSATSFTATDVDAEDAWGRKRFVKGRLLRIEDELIEVTDANTTTNVVTIIRGVRGSTAVAHLAGVDIKSWRVIETIEEAVLNVAKTWRESDIAAGGRLGVSDYSAGVEVGIPADFARIIKAYRKSIL